MKTPRLPSQTLPAALSALVSATLLSTASAQTNLFEDFESGFSTQGWVTGASSTPLTIASGVNKVPAAGTQSARMAAASDVEAVTLPTAVSAVPWKFTYWLDDNDANATRAFATIRNYSGGTYNSGTMIEQIAAGKYNNVNSGSAWTSTRYQGRVLYPSTLGWFNLDDPGAPNRSSGWHKFDIVCGQDANSAYILLFYIDGLLSKSLTNSDYHLASLPNAATIGSVGSPATTVGSAYFDGLQVVQGIPFISLPPQPTTVTQGNPLSFYVNALGNGPLSYQWRRSGTNIDGATDASFVINSAALSDATSYTVVVSNSLDVATASAVAQVLPLIQITTPPTNQMVNLGAPATFNAQATGNGTLSYIWSHNGTPIPGATGSGYQPFDFFYQVASASLSDAGTYTLTVTNDWGDPPTTVSAVLTVNTAPTLPAVADTNAFVGQPFTMAVSATDDFSAQATPFQVFETNSVGTPVTFGNPYQSGTTEPYVDGLGRTYVTNGFPAGHGSGHVLYSHFTFTNVNNANWLRFTTTDSAGSGVQAGNPIISFATPLRFDIYADKALAVGLGLRETESTGPIGSNNGASTAPIEFAGVTAYGGANPPPTITNIVPAGVWTTVTFPLPNVAVTSFNAGNGALDLATGKGVLEHLCLTDGTTPGHTGDYNIWLDNFVSMPINALSFSLDTAPTGAVIDAATGVITWTPATTGSVLFKVRATDTMGLSSTASFHVTAVIPPPLVFNISRTGNNVMVTWNDSSYTLQAAPRPTGAFTNVPGAVSGYTTGTDASALFFRLAK